MQIKNISRDDLAECIVSYQTIITTMLYSYSSLILFIVKGEQDTATKLLYACVGCGEGGERIGRENGVNAGKKGVQKTHTRKICH